MDIIIKKTNLLVNNRVFQLIFGVILGFVSLLYALQNINIFETIQILRMADPFWLALSVGSVFVGIVCKAFRWSKLISISSNSINTFRLGLLLFASHALNTIYPIRVGEFYRIYMASCNEIGIIRSLVIIMLEKFFDLLVLAGFLLSMLLFSPYPEWINHNFYWQLLVVGIVSFFLFWFGIRKNIFQKFIEMFSRRFQGNIRTQLLGFVQSVDTYSLLANNRLVLINILSWSVIIWLIAALTNFYTFKAVMINLPFFVAIFLLVLLQFGISLPGLPGKIGIFEVICILVLKSYDIPQNEALGFAILLHIIVYLPAMIVGLAVLWYFGVSKNNNQLNKYFHLEIEKKITGNDL